MRPVGAGVGKAAHSAAVETFPAAPGPTFPEYARRWLASRAFSWEVETRRRIPGNLAHHLNPAFPGPIDAITTTDVLEWLAGRLTGDPPARPPTPRSSMKLYYDLFNTIMRSAETDRMVTTNPCRAVRLARVFRGLSTVPRWVPTESQVLRLLDAVPDRYRAAVWLGAAQGCRIGEVLGLEDSTHCVDLNPDPGAGPGPGAGPDVPAVGGRLHVVQQLQYDTAEHGGFFLKEPKAGSTGTVDLDQHVRDVLRGHLDRWGTTEVTLVDTTPPTLNRSAQARSVPASGRHRSARLLFTDAKGRPFHDKRWSEHWTRWREEAGWPARDGAFHALRHFCATVMLTHGVDPQHVQKILRHASLQMTLDTYAHWLPAAGRRINVVSAALRAARNTTETASTRDRR